MSAQLDPVGCPRRESAASAALIATEAFGATLLWAPIPVLWMWIGSLVYELTESLMADMVCALLGFLATTMAMMWALNRIDAVWIARRRRAGHDQREGVLTRIVIASAAVGLLGFWLWFNLSGAVVIQFMPRY